MKILLLADIQIEQDELDELQRRFTDLIYENTGIDPTYFVEEQDYTDYPTYIDSDGDVRPTDNYLRTTCADISKRYSGEGTDHVVFLIHEDNWKSPTIWGTNYSNVFSGYQVQYCRFDRDNMANSLGTLYHEVLHSADALIKTYTGVNVAKVLGVSNWDRDVVHGKGAGYDYIRHNENQSALQYISPWLVESYQKRDKIYQEKIGKMKTIVTILTQVVALLRQIFNKKNGITK